MSEEKLPATVEDLLSEIHRKIDANKGADYIFRGEAEAYEREKAKGCECDDMKACECSKTETYELGKTKKYRKITSNLYRAYECVLKMGEDAKDAWYRLTMDDIKKRTIADAKRYTTEENDKAILDRVQHYGGETNRIDFSYDYLIALFFACDGPHDRDGRLILYDKRPIEETQDAENAEAELIPPREPRERVIAQKSIFVCPKSGVLDVNKENIITIPKTLKQPILNFLRTRHNITTYTIYNDLHGYIRQNKDHKEAYKYFYLGHYHKHDGRWHDWRRACHAGEKQRTEARIKNAIRQGNADKNNIQEYEKKIREEEQEREKHAKAKDKAYRKAIEKYTKAIEINPQFAEVYFHRGVAHGILLEHKEAIQDYTEATNINSQMIEAYGNRARQYDTLSFKKQNKEEQYALFENALKDYYEVLKSNSNDINEYSLLFSVYQDFCNQAEGDTAKRLLRKRLKPIVDDALKLAKAQGDESLRNSIREIAEQHKEDGDDTLSDAVEKIFGDEHAQ